MDSSSSSSTFSHFNSFSRDDDILYDMDEKATMFFQCGLVTCNAQEFFNLHEMEEGNGRG
jgi:hypothetical protein